MADEQLKLLIVEARFYDDIADGLLDGAKKALDAAGAAYEVVTVPGALEVPGVISMAIDAAYRGGKQFDGFVALGCIIRGETYHFEIVANESARGLTDIAVKHCAAIGNGILTVENMEQARARITKSEGAENAPGKGAAAALAALKMIEIRKSFGS
ncbi:6,7-dimethyl-8-ribityllumazine synthase [Nitratireductor basaltis]|uniref:6,7-dimethyl-8-ribityllumazine synthase n=1 Tax=Nitratireductor basaltis TaxID=472175 RepID=A0A084UBW7_9HYPH|nr:6,7-dimethyl-8-ribityllumazine synthase [Nitratireductor basaltis]KFB10453.1 6,7-dimethyl-8-ribityllumazine synthase [Nitratireductor basaltis]